MSKQEPNIPPQKPTPPEVVVFKDAGCLLAIVHCGFWLLLIVLFK